MSRYFDDGKNQYGIYALFIFSLLIILVVYTILSYSSRSKGNYRMGSKESNSQNRQLDNAILGTGSKESNSQNRRLDKVISGEGSKESNFQNRRLDNAILGESCSNAGWSEGYNVARLMAGTDKTPGLSRQQQLDGIGDRFDAAKAAYEATGEYKYYMLQKDLRDIAQNHLNGDMREFRLSRR